MSKYRLLPHSVMSMPFDLKLHWMLAYEHAVSKQQVILNLCTEWDRRILTAGVTPLPPAIAGKHDDLGGRRVGLSAFIHPVLKSQYPNLAPHLPRNIPPERFFFLARPYAARIVMENVRKHHPPEKWPFPLRAYRESLIEPALAYENGEDFALYLQMEQALPEPDRRSSQTHPGRARLDRFQFQILLAVLKSYLEPARYQLFLHWLKTSLKPDKTPAWVQELLADEHDPSALLVTTTPDRWDIEIHRAFLRAWFLFLSIQRVNNPSIDDLHQELKRNLPLIIRLQPMDIPALLQTHPFESGESIQVIQP